MTLKKSIILKYIWLLPVVFMTVILMAACSDSNAISDNSDQEVELIPGRSIVFSTGTATRALPVTQLRGKGFGVKAYVLDNQWASAGYNAKPDTDWNDILIDCSNSGVCTYNPIQSWMDNKYYSFFGYYPYNAPGVTVSDSNYESAPYIEYRPSANDATQHQDVMVASTLDCTALNTGQVRMQFSHILFCINIAVNNYDDEAIRLDNVTCRITSGLYSNYKVKMDKSDPVASGNIANASYLMTNSIHIPNTSATGAMNITDSDRFLMLIPQKGLRGQISFDVTQGGQTTTKVVEFDDSGTEYRAGYRYTFTLYFVGDAIYLRIIQNNEWADNDSDIEFD